MSGVFRILGSGVLLISALARADEFPEGRIRQQLAGIGEAEVRQGAQACVDANSVRAVELLLEVMDRERPHTARALSPGHYRDIAWDALVAIKDPYARDRVEDELRKNRKNPWVRQWCAELLGIYGDARYGDTLIRAASDKHPAVQRWAARSLGMLAFEKAVPVLEKLARDKDVYIRANAIEALARIDAAKFGPAFLAAVRGDEDGGVRCALLGAAAGLFPGELLALCREEHEDEDWRPRIQAVEHLSGIEVRESLEALIDATDDVRPIVVDRANATLRAWSGTEIADRQGWLLWWGQNKDTFKFPEEKKKEAEEAAKKEAGGAKKEPGKAPEAPKAPEIPERAEPAAKEEPPEPKETRTVAFGLPLVSDHVAFVVDKSQRMVDTLKATGTSKDEAARAELERIWSKLHGRLVFNVYCYREDVRAFKKEPLELDEKAQERALRFVKKQPTKGAKDIWQVLEIVVADPSIDTVYLLSSGEPDVGLYVHWNRVTRHLADLNRWHKVTVHTVVYSERQWFRDQLEKIAEATGGRFRWYE
jgi:HEAT repeat protein